MNAALRLGFPAALACYLIWGSLPLYIRAMQHVGPFELLAHRILWSVPVAGLVLIFLRRTKDLAVALRTPRMLGMACVTAALVSVNWGVYVWAINTGQALEAALGYFINPLFSVALGALLLRERLSRPQLAAIALATVAVVILTVEQGRLPLTALCMTLSWGFYAFFKKWLPIGPNQGFLLEVLILSPLAVGWLIWLAAQGSGSFAMSWGDTLLLMGSGVVTAVPLILYANGAKLVRLSTIAILQYIAPTMIFLNAVFVFGEPMDRARMIAFPLIWAALVIYSWTLVRQMRRA